MLIRLLIFIALIIVIEGLFYRGIIHNHWNSTLKWSHLLFTTAVYIFFIYQILKFDRSQGATTSFYWALGFLLLSIVPKLVSLLFLTITVLGDILWNTVTKEPSNSRRQFLKNLSLAVGSIPFLGIVHGIWKGRYNFKVIQHKLAFSDLPKAFHGFKILQISDIHSGSFDNKEKIEYAIDLINQQEADILLFTGDIVNTKATEFHPWIDTFIKIKSFPCGKFSVLGNHDYGEYVTWPSEKDKVANFEAIKNLHPSVNFQLLCNENVTIEKNAQQIKLIGVENWGKNFKQAGDLNKASKGVLQDDFKILMSHDPSHWEEEVKNHSKNYHLTLSGHTHGLQFGIEIPGFIKWSPVQYIYKQWAGIYKNNDRFINVNRGFGYHAFPGRVGIWPEITVIELQNKELQAQFNG